VTGMSVAFSVEPAEVSVSALVAGVKGAWTDGQPAFDGVAGFVDLPSVSLLMNDASGRLLSHAKCDLCAYAWLTLPSGSSACDAGLAIADTSVECLTVVWDTEASSFCDGSGDLFQEGVTDLVTCQQLCIAEPACAGITFYPPAAKTSGAVSDLCFLSLGSCSPRASVWGTVYYRPPPDRLSGEDCRCPKHEFDGQTVEATMVSPGQPSSVTHTPLRPVLGGSAAFSGLWVKYVPLSTITLSLKIIGVPLTASTAPVVLLPGLSEPPSYETTPLPQPSSQCACSAIPGLDILPQTNFTASPGSELAPDVDLATLTELRALGCRCFFPSTLEGTCLGDC